VGVFLFQHTLCTRFLASHSKQTLFDILYGGMDEPELKIIDVFICKLRKKLCEATMEDSYIETVWGRGYVLRDPIDAEQVVPQSAMAG
jgi:two-component system cell cycle response regulator CtrA